MALFNWNPMFNVGINKIDSDHQELVRLINKVYDSLQKGNSESAIKQSIVDLLGYTRIHFKAEEDLMGMYGYQLVVRHRLLHKKLIEKLEKFSNKINADFIQQDVHEHVSFLKNWLFEHIMKADMHFGNFLKSKNVQ